MINKVLSYLTTKILFRIWICSIFILVIIHYYHLVLWSELHYLNNNLNKIKQPHFRMIQSVEENFINDRNWINNIEYLLTLFKENNQCLKVELILSSKDRSEAFDHLVSKYPDNFLLQDSENIFMNSKYYQYYDLKLIAKFPVLRKKLIEFYSFHQNGFLSTKMTNQMYQSFFKDQNLKNKFELGKLLFPLDNPANSLYLTYEGSRFLNKVSLDYLIDCGDDQYWDDLKARTLSVYKKHEPIMKKWAECVLDQDIGEFDFYLQSVEKYVSSLKNYPDDYFIPSCWESSIIGGDFFIGMMLDSKIQTIRHNRPISLDVFDYKQNLTYSELINFLGEKETRQLISYLIHLHIKNSYQQVNWINDLEQYLKKQKEELSPSQLIFL